MSLPLNVESRGTGGTPVLFVHSFAGDLTHWSAQLEHLKATRRVVAFDLSGHGKSPGALGPYSIRELAKDVAEVADAQELEQFVLVGHSMGAFIATEYAGVHPRRVKGLGLIDAPPAPGAVPDRTAAADPRRGRQGSVCRGGAILEAGTVPGFAPRGPGQTTGRAASALAQCRGRAHRGHARFDATKLLRNFRGPRFAIVTPNNDAPLSLHNVVPGIQHTVIKGTGHWIHLDKPAEFNLVLDIFLRGL